MATFREKDAAGCQMRENFGWLADFVDEVHADVITNGAGTAPSLRSLYWRIRCYALDPKRIA